VDGGGPITSYFVVLGHILLCRFLVVIRMDCTSNYIYNVFTLWSVHDQLQFGAELSNEFSDALSFICIYIRRASRYGTTRMYEYMFDPTP
jgi:hypothetical protein